MKILPLVGQAFDAQNELAPLLIAELMSLFESKDNRWFFDIRAKEAESFALKAESGRVSDLDSMEDFVGCMMVVPLQADLQKAEEFVAQFFAEDYRRPQSSDTASKAASDFPFDDLRLYGHLLTPTDLPPRPIDQIRFEIQLKTYLQHAWSIATHDLVYKFDRVSWARNRVAYQIKALLEHAELSVSSIEELEASGNLQKHGSPEDEQQAIIDVLKREWPAEDLPEDKRRLATNIWKLLNLCEVPCASFAELLERGRTKYDGLHPRVLSPFLCVVEYLSLFHADELIALLTGETIVNGSYKIPVTDEILARLQLKPETAVRAFV